MLFQLHIICHAVHNLTSTPTLQWLLVPLKNGDALDRASWLRAKKSYMDWNSDHSYWIRTPLFEKKKRKKANKKFGSNGTLEHRSLLNHPLLVLQECFVGRIFCCACYQLFSLYWLCQISHCFLIVHCCRLLSCNSEKFYGSCEENCLLAMRCKSLAHFIPIKMEFTQIFFTYLIWMQFVYIYKSFGQIHWNGIRYHNLYHWKNNLQIE